MKSKFTFNGMVAAVFFAAAVSIALCACIKWLEGQAYGGDEVEPIAQAIDELAVIEHERAETLARIILEVSRDRGFDPLLIVSLVMRESSFSISVEEGNTRGALGEVGLMQTQPRIAQRFAPGGCDFYTSAVCQLRTGTRYLAFVRDQCPGSPWRWISAYGRSSCPTEEEAREDRAVRRAFAYYQQIGGTTWQP